MKKTFKIIKVNSKYCDFLRKYDPKVTYNKGSKDLRPFVGALFKLETQEYFAPLSSPKKKHEKMVDKIDFIKINKGKYGAINLNNMIPVTKNQYKLLDLKNSENKGYTKILQNQLYWLNRKIKNFMKTAEKLYNKYPSRPVPMMG